MSLTLSTLPTTNRRALWAATFIAASIIFSFGWACALPLAGFAAVAALTTRASRGPAADRRGLVRQSGRGFSFPALSDGRHDAVLGRRAWRHRFAVV